MRDLDNLQVSTFNNILWTVCKAIGASSNQTSEALDFQALFFFNVLKAISGEVKSVAVQ